MLPVINKILRKDRGTVNDKGIYLDCPIVIQVRFKGQRKQIFTGLRINSDQWDEEQQTVTKKYSNHVLYNQMLNKKVSDLEEKYLKESLSNEEPDITKSKKVEKKLFYDYGVAFFRSKKSNSLDYINRSIYALRDFKNFAGDLSFKQITPEVLQKFDNYLLSKDNQIKEEKGIAQNTRNRIFKRIKQVFTEAQKHKLVTDNPFDIFTPPAYKQTKRSFLTMDEVNRIEELELSGELETVRNYFILACYTGLRYSDCRVFNPKKAVVKNKGVERIIIGTTKTDEIVSIKVTPKIKSVIAKLKTPLGLNHHVNNALKIIGKQANISQPLTFHQARHSFAINSASLGIPIEAVAKLLGHSSIRTTGIYYKLTDTKIDEYMDRWSQ